MTSITYASLALDGPIELEQILDTEMDISANCHATVVVRGILKGDVLQTMRRQPMGAKAALRQEGALLPVFTGVVLDFAIRHLNGYNEATVEILSDTIELDREIRSRSFQDIKMTYKQLIYAVLDKYGEDAGFISHYDVEQRSIGQPLVQYRETDWAFLKRIATHFNTSLIPEVTRGGPKFYLGLKKGMDREEYTGAPVASGVGDRYYRLGGVYLGYRRSDFLCHEVISMEDYGVGDNVPFRGDVLKVCRKTGRLNRGGMEFIYTLGKQGLVAENTAYNEQISGMSLLGTVLTREAETLKIHFDIDEEQDEGTAYPYEWTPATGNLMYLMPQAGTRVSVYFASADERSGKAVSCVRTNGGEQAEQSGMGDYNKRSLVTEHKASLLLHPESLSMRKTNGADETGAVDIADGKDVQLISPKHMRIQAKGRVTLEGRTVVFAALGQGSGKGAAPPVLMVATIPMRRIEAEGGGVQLLLDVENTRSMIQSCEMDRAYLNLLTRRGRTVLAGREFCEMPMIEDAPVEGEFPVWKFLGNVLAAVVTVAAVAALTVLTFGVGTAIVVGAVGAIAGASMLVDDFNSGNARDTLQMVGNILKAQVITLGVCVFAPVFGGLAFLGTAGGAFLLGAGLDVIGQVTTDPKTGKNLFDAIGDTLLAGLALTSPVVHAAGFGDDAARGLVAGTGKIGAGLSRLFSADAWLDWHPRQTVETGVTAVAMQQAIKGTMEAIFEPKVIESAMTGGSRTLVDTKTGLVVNEGYIMEGTLYQARNFTTGHKYMFMEVSGGAWRAYYAPGGTGAGAGGSTHAIQGLAGNGLLPAGPSNMPMLPGSAGNISVISGNTAGNALMLSGTPGKTLALSGPTGKPPMLPGPAAGLTGVGSSAVALGNPAGNVPMLPGPAGNVPMLPGQASNLPVPIGAGDDIIIVTRGGDVPNQDASIVLRQIESQPPQIPPSKAEIEAIDTGAKKPIGQELTKATGAEELSLVASNSNEVGSFRVTEPTGGRLDVLGTKAAPPGQLQKGQAGTGEVVAEMSNAAAVQRANDLKNTLTKSKLPTATSAVIDARTGKIYYGDSGSISDNINAVLKNRMPSESQEMWDIRNCAEFNAVNNALNDGASINDLTATTVRVKTGTAFPRCRNCKITLDGIYFTSD